MPSKSNVNEPPQPPSNGRPSLDVERIYSEPSLNGSSIRALRFSPNGKQATFVKAKKNDSTQFDLWAYDIESKETHVLVDSKSIDPSEEEWSDEEKARRERMRLFDKGIVSYYWSDDASKLLFPLNGNLYCHHLEKKGPDATQQITNSESFQTDVRFSPKGNYVSFVREQNLHLVEINTKQERALTKDGGGSIKNAMAEFVAQEEMGRMTGYWWSDDEKYIAFTQIDEEPVQISQRQEIYADSIEIYDQRYPYAGTPNVKVKLGIVEVETGEIKWIDLGENEDIYLARVNWTSDNQALVIQRESRDQKTLDLLYANAKSGEVKPLLQESSDIWINLHNDLHFLKDNKHFIWASERSGFKHLYLYNMDGEMIRPLTSGEWVVGKLHGVDESTGTVFFDGFAKNPLEKHLYSINLETKTAKDFTQITSSEGWHEIELSSDYSHYIDHFSNSTTPPQVILHSLDGTHTEYLEENKVAAGHPLYPYQDQMSEVEYGTIQSVDGQDLHFSLIKPKDFDPEKQYPVLVDVYGGPHAQKVTKQWRAEKTLWNQYMANKGYLVFSIDNRGSTNRGLHFESAIYRNMGTPEVEDQKTGVNYLKTLPYVDGNNIGVFGWSYGGYMTLLMLMKEPETFHSGIAVAPVTEWDLYDTHYTERYMGDPKENAEAYKKSSVFSYVDGLKGDLFLVHGMADDNVLFSNSTKLMKVLQDKDKAFELMTYPGAKHAIAGKAPRTHLFKAISHFLDKTLTH
ncbi:MAG: S9 family peptidase [Waddliaceae bacterium]|nr:S9 family peptidase [Waddliaceae bacterium]